MSVMWGALSAALVAGIPEQDRSRMDPGLLAMAEDGKRYDLKDYLAAYNARTTIARSMAEFHRRYDLLLTPQMPVTAIEAGRTAPAGSPAGSWLDWSPYTYPFNLTQQPAASIPCGFSSEGLPVGLQIVGPARGDAVVLRAARAFARIRPRPILDEPRGAR
jgi:aspartyl-tRNA(Asn)/glutamyl-tRNA(Gln) amidotransferase subunit A